MESLVGVVVEQRRQEALDVEPRRRATRERVTDKRKRCLWIREDLLADALVQAGRLEWSLGRLVNKALELAMPMIRRMESPPKPPPDV